MKNIIALFLSLTVLMLCGSTDAVFHFDFKDAADKKSYPDRSGKFTATPKTGVFAVERGALRLAPGAQVSVNDPREPKALDQMTAMGWILKKSTPDVTPILMKGEHPYDVSFLLSVGWRCPQFAFKNQPRQSFWKGVYYNGVFGSSIHYPDGKFHKKGTPLIESSGYWRHVAAVFDKGDVKIYIDGVLTAESRSEKSEKLSPNKLPFLIGAERIADVKANSMTADMLLNDLRYYERALDAGEVRSIMKAEEPKYPRGNLIPKGETHLNALAPCHTYLPPEFDLAMKRILPVTAAFEASCKRQKITPVSASIVRDRNQTPQIALNGQIVPPLMGVPGLFDFSGNKLINHNYAMGVRNFAAAGINLVSVPAFPEYFWKAEGVYDWTELDKACGDALKGNPDARLMIYINSTAPAWFVRKHPGELEQTRFGKDQRAQTAGPLGSDLWVRVQSRMLRDLVHHMESSSAGKSTFAYLIGGGQSAEWYWPGSVTGGVPGYSEGTAKSFRRYLKDRYKNDVARLRKAWNQPDVTFENALVPSVELRRTSEKGLFRDPASAAQVIDFRTYMTHQTVHNIAESAKAVKEACERKKLVVIYSGYNLPVISRKLFHSGLCGGREIMRLSDVDIVVTPIDYGRRRGKETGLRVNPFEASARLAGKVMFQEDDPRTHLSLVSESGRSETLQETQEVQKRSLAQALTRGAGCWWLLFDSAWYHQNEIITTLKHNQQIMRSALSQDCTPTADIAVIFDEQSHFLLADSGSSFLQLHTWELYQNLMRSGAVADFLYLDDLRDPAVRDYKLYIFAHATHITPAMRSVIQKRLAKRDASVLWCYAPGYYDGQHMNVKNMESLTGFQFKEHAKLNGVSPAFTVEPGERTFASRQTDMGQSTYSLNPLSIEQLHNVCRQAGVHIYTDSNVHFYANRSYGMIHTHRAGDVTVTLPRKARVRELYSGKEFGTVQNFTDNNLPAGVTRLYQFTGEPVTAP